MLCLLSTCFKGCNMEIRIKRTGMAKINGDPGAGDVTTTYSVTDNGREFKITYRSHRYGASLGIAGEAGVLYTDTDDNTVHKHVLAVGRGCGIGVESDELVEGLSPWSVRGVILAGRSGEAGEIVLSFKETWGPSDTPAVLVDGEVAGLNERP
jgi:hypothetical protein